VGVGVVVLRPDAVLLVRRARPPLAGAWSIPAGAQRLGETAEACARRELAEETGLAVGPLALCFHTDLIEHDPNGAVRFHYAVLDFCARWQGGEPRAASDAAAAAWAPLGGLDAFRLTPGLRDAIAAAVRILPPPAGPA
jgi:ADP-ribose pyrophosphatase YjhB (NUDIX family)